MDLRYTKEELLSQFKAWLDAQWKQHQGIRLPAREQIGKWLEYEDYKQGEEWTVGEGDLVGKLKKSCYLAIYDAHKNEGKSLLEITREIYGLRAEQVPAYDEEADKYYKKVVRAYRKAEAIIHGVRRTATR